MERPVCSACGALQFDDSGFGLSICLACGTAKPGPISHEFGNPFFRADRVMPKQCYTRKKRFKKYLFRCMRQQSASTVPPETWKYLLANGPYRDAQHIQRVLKLGRHLKRKSYDSLPFLTAALCPHITVPELTEQEKHRALALFRQIDQAIREGPFISYLYCLEYILIHMERSDMCPHINRIQCPKRRQAYKLQLDRIFMKNRNGVDDLLRHPVDTVEPL